MQEMLGSQPYESSVAGATIGWLLALGGVFVFFLFAVNWKRLWPVLQAGGSIPLTLLLVLIALVWSQIAPREATVLSGLSIGNFWWQLIVVGLMACWVLLAGWLQDRYEWDPPEFALESAAPPGAAHHHSDRAEHAVSAAPGDSGHGSGYVH